MNTLEYLRQFRVLDYAVFDISIALVGMWIISPLLSKVLLKANIKVPKVSWVIWALPIGILAHILTGNMTPMTLNFVDLNEHYLLKVVIFILISLGFRGIHKVNKSKS
ncbi:MAG: hypothetical protein Q8P30_01345 [Candidatus Uhrbacteria bacterium]|nr:hypothetical protein [Candidatus Uhrbacteria bacterium]